MRRNSEEKLSVEHFHPWDTTFITGLSDYRFTAGLRSYMWVYEICTSFAVLEIRYDIGLGTELN